MASASSSEAKMWGKILLHNKLLTPEQWQQCLDMHVKTDRPIDQILHRDFAIRTKFLDQIRAKIASMAPGDGKPAESPSPAAPEARATPTAPPPKAAPPSIEEGAPADGIELAEADPTIAPIRPPAADYKAPAAEPALPTLPETHQRSGTAQVEPDPEAAAIVRRAIKAGASDIHIASGSPPFMRQHGKLVLFDAPKLLPDQARRMALSFMNESQQERFIKHHDLDFSYEHRELGRFRANALEQFRGTDIVFRVIPPRVPSLADLGLPESLGKFTEWHQGLVLITGPSGCGKSTTAAALLDLVNSTRKDHIITVEDPIEYLQRSKGCNVTQRQVPTHTNSFASALKAALREDPDVIMIGEMRDLETVSLAIRAAETGHLVIGTLQTKSAARTIDRVVDVFPSEQQAQIRMMLSESLRGVISQQLIARADGKGRVVALEVLHVNTAVSNLIRDSKTFQLPSLMQTGRKAGMRLMDESIVELFREGLITKEDAIGAAENGKKVQAMISGGAAVSGGAK